MTSDPLPRPSLERFQPLRSGLVNVYRYDDQEFWFDGGHLLLRGNNGTGKSRVLAMQLPFLFDGEVAPHRMEPDGDPAKRVEWNLLLGGRHADRLGYTWIEFGRRAPELATGEEFVTLGCGLSAAAGRGLVGRWFFVTPKRVGLDLFLVAPNGQPLSRERLGESIGAENLHVTAAAHRDAVDRALFGLGKVRYEALVNLLIQLRQPQLSRQLDEARLSAALSDALPPPAASIVADVAEAFRALEADREALDGFRAASGAVEQFLVEYRRYAQIAARRRATLVRGRHSAYEESMRRLRDAERELGEAKQAEEAVAARIEQVRIDEQAARARVETLASSPAMQDAQALRRTRTAAESAAADVAHGDTELLGRRDTLARREADLIEARKLADTAQQGLAERHERLHRAAARSGIEGRHDEVAAVAGDQGIVPALEGLLDELRRALRLLRRLSEDLRLAEASFEQANARVRGLEGDTDAAAQAQRTAAADLGSDAQALFIAYRGWAARARSLTPPPPDDLIDAFTTWTENPDGPSPLVAAVANSLAATLERLAAAGAAAESRLASVRTRVAELHDERDRLVGGAHRPPPISPTRDGTARQNRDGAPLWRLVDFAPGIGDEQAAGIEAALEAAGILDAWVTPDGRLLGPGEHDALLVAVGPSLAALDRRCPHLGTALQPAVDRSDARAALVADETIRGLLEQIALGMDAPAAAAVDYDGHFRLGPVDGRWSKPAAEHIGDGARQAARHRRIAELAPLIEGALAEERVEERAVAAIRGATAAAQAEAAAAPDDQPVRVAAAELEACGRTLRLARERLADAQTLAWDAKQACVTRRETRDQAAADLGLAAFADDLTELEDALALYGAEIAALTPALTHRRITARGADEAAVRADEARHEAAKADERLLDLRGRAAALAAEREVLETSVGAAVEEILARFAEAQQRSKELRAGLDDLGKQERKAHDRTVLGQSAVERTVEELDTHDKDRAAAAASLGRLAATRLLGVAVPALAGEVPATWSITRTVDVARAVEAELERIDTSDAAWERSGKGVFAQVQMLEQALLPQGHQATTTMEDDLVIVTMPFQGRVHTMTEFGEVLASEVTSRQTLLSAREREVLENHLVGEVSMHLHDRLHAAEQLVREMNDELEARPMSTGMTLRFSWKALDDGPPGLLEARRRLMRTGGTWSGGEREALGSFLEKRIADVRAVNQTGSWQDHLAEALDYRKWHHFGVERRQDGEWKPLTRRTHGTGSGGEKAVALTLPQFAAAAAHYRSAHPKAPRLILLDEVFVGVDSDMRAKCMGLLATFDLDFVMTSEREWGCYATLPALAIYQLATRPGIDAVGVTRFVWNGRERLQAEVEAPGARASAPASVQIAEGATLGLPTIGEA